MSSHRSCHPFVTAPLLLATLVVFGGCGTQDTGAGSDRDAPDTSASDVAPITDAGGGGSDASDIAIFDSGEERDTAEPDLGPPPGQPGDPCADDADCESSLCVDLIVGEDDASVCSDFCTDDDQCPDGFDCVLLANSGGDAQQVCLPVDLCVDFDADGYGIGPGCQGPDCDDVSPSVNPAADELCNGFDDDCDGRVDETPVGAAEDCDTGFPGVCGTGRLACDSGSLVCEGVADAADETCNGLDDDCDGDVDEDAEDAATWFEDQDGDGFGNESSVALSCTRPDGYVADSRDCDDTSELFGPEADELCDELDNDCDGEIDESVTFSDWWPDIDGDGYGDASADPINDCAPPEGYVGNAEDCDDADPLVSPDASEMCDELDNDCDGATDEDDAVDAPTWFADSDEDGFGNARIMTQACAAPDGYVGDATDCDDGDDENYPEAPEVCDGEDNDCDEEIDESGAAGEVVYYADGDGDGFGTLDTTTLACGVPDGHVTNPDDCDDSDPDVNPAAIEVCDSIDNNCREGIDEPSAADARTWYADTDEDGFGNPRATQRACDAPTGYVADAIDCNDSSPISFPEAEEICDGLDNDCDDVIDEAGATGERNFYRDGDGDRYGSPSDTVIACSAPAGYVDDATDCDDTTALANPGIAVESCDNLDNNCSGGVDEGLSRTCTSACGAGDEVCTAGSWGGCTAPPVIPETCDRVDSDCDGTIDEGVSCRTPVYRKRLNLGVTPAAPRDPLCDPGVDRTLYQYLYTTSAGEASGSFETERSPDYELYTSPAAGLVPFYRCYRSDTNRHFYTTSGVCELWDSASFVESVMGYIQLEPTSDAVPLYRLYQPETNVHFYTTDPGERNTATRCWEYEGEGIAGYVWQP